MTTPRLFIENRIEAHASTALAADQAHYLANVLRLTKGAPLRVFNGVDGEWAAKLVEVSKRAATIQITQKIRLQATPPRLCLIFAPLKKTRTDFVVEKATELGATTIQPVFSDRTNADRVKIERLQALAKEAAEQTERLDVPHIEHAEALSSLLDRWPSDCPNQSIIYCDEGAPRDTAWTSPAAQATGLLDCLLGLHDGPDASSFAPGAILIGPEGGFSPHEQERLRGAAFAIPVSLGPRILRAETAALAALTIWQAVCGDWSSDPSETQNNLQ